VSAEVFGFTDSRLLRRQAGLAFMDLKDESRPLKQQRLSTPAGDVGTCISVPPSSKAGKNGVAVENLYLFDKAKKDPGNDKQPGR